MSKKIGCFIGMTLTLFAGALWINYRPDDFPLVVFLVLLLGWTFGFLFRKFIDADAILRRDSEIARQDEEIDHLNFTIATLTSELQETKNEVEASKIVKMANDVTAMEVSAKETTKQKAVKSTKTSKNIKKAEKKVTEQNKD